MSEAAPGPLKGRQVVKAVGAAVALRLLWLAYEKTLNVSWKSMTESQAYEAWLKFCKTINQHALPEYLPKDAQGKRMSVPSATPMVAATSLPHSVSEARILAPARLRGLTLRNRVIRAAAFDGENEQDCIQTHVDVAKGGVGMTTVAYCCVSSNGRSFDNQLVMEASRSEFLHRLTNAVHEHGAAISAQLTHGGSFADRAAIGHEYQVAPSVVFNPAGFDFPRAMTLEDCNVMADNFAKAAGLAKECGFDCIELHAGHGYLLSQFLSPRMNLRNDCYGGTPEKRAAFPAECLRRCRAAVGDDFPIIVKLNVHDGRWFGLELADATIAAHALADASADAIIVTCGSVAHNGFYMMRGNTPQAKLVQALPHAAKKLAMMVFGPVAVPDVPYEDCFLRESARHILAEVGNKTTVVLMGGVNSFSEMEGAMEEGFGFVQIARGLIREPDLVNRIEASLRLRALVNNGSHPTPLEDGEDDEISNPRSSCIRCNMCVIATVDPQASFGCPFQKMDAARRTAAGKPAVFAVADYERELAQDVIRTHAVRQDADLGDIEDLIAVSARHAGKV
ncbi:12-oxophytodienoate reductase-like protein [Hondaea fermentalgiana]|uniref:12-oxophytodienoate reductase-like protein n=1 Tax=Hondaea fermentalgiana TaxID=2315210 RepID=A0A2R5GW93_9STRA|nr:12-oxophytodienoate reductase-like protein [Hondaea fermentalgiana]|eukprot:GBG32933.1 12-oxophytodienoate reductase-like protein [Hondaea fermentalgiana]